MSYQTCVRDLPPKYLFLPPSSLEPLDRCEEHGEGLSVFCLDDLEPLCQQCAAENHTGHRVYLLAEAASDCKEELRASLNGLNVRMMCCRKISQTCQHTSRHNQAEAKWAEDLMRQEFETLHQFLRQEEASRLWALREERDEKMRWAAERRGEINQVIKSLEEKIQLAEDEIDAGGDGAEFLKNYGDTVNSSRGADREPPSLGGSLINVAEHLGNLQYAVWAKMKHVAPLTPVTFDSRTAGPSLLVSPELNGVRVGPGPSQAGGDVVGDPERLHPYSYILGREGFSSGVHHWTVQVGDTDSWTLGVAAPPLCRRAELGACPKAGLWCIGLVDGSYQALTEPSQILHVDGPDRIRKIHVRCDWEAGTLTFANADTDAHLYTFTHAFSQVVHPYFEISAPGGDLVLLGQRVNLSVWSECVPDEDPLMISEEDRLKRKSTPAKEFATSSDAGERTTGNRHPAGEQKSPNHAAKEAKKTKPGGKKTPSDGTAAKKKPAKSRFDATYHVSLNRAMSGTSHRANNHEESEK